MSLGTELRQRRHALGYTRAQFGTLLGVSDELVARLETDRYPYVLRPAVRRRVETMLGCVLPPRPAKKPRRIPPRDLTRLGARIAQRRRALGLSQQALGERARMHMTAICRLERDRARPSAQLLARLALALECSVEELREEENEGI
jgi:transcriptional regulator with XRE-family HTH domain